jgi:hypothetical protein
MIRALAFGSAAILCVVGCGEEGVMSSTPIPSCGTAGSTPATGSGAGGAKVQPSGSGGVVTGTAGTTATMGGATGMVGTTDTGGTTGTAGTTDMGGATGMGGATDTGGATGMAGATGAGGAEQPPGPCPTGYNCVDLASLGAMAVDGSGMPVTASCGMGAPSGSCDDANPASTCPGFTKPLCAHVSVAGMQIVSCGQRCTP